MAQMENTIIAIAGLVIYLSVVYAQKKIKGNDKRVIPWAILCSMIWAVGATLAVWADMTTEIDVSYIGIAAAVVSTGLPVAVFSMTQTAIDADDLKRKIKLIEWKVDKAYDELHLEHGQYWKGK